MGATAPRRDLLDAGIRFITPFLAAGISPPHVVPTNRGGVQFEWHCGLEIEVVDVDRIEVVFTDEATDETIELVSRR